MKDSIDRNLLYEVAGQVMAAGVRASGNDPLAVSDDTLGRLADLSVRAAMAVGEAMQRVEDALKAKAKTGEKKK